MKSPSAPSQVWPPIASSSSSTLVSSMECHRETPLALNDNESCGPEQPGAHELCYDSSLNISACVCAIKVNVAWILYTCTLTYPWTKRLGMYARMRLWYDSRSPVCLFVCVCVCGSGGGG